MQARAAAVIVVAWRLVVAMLLLASAAQAAEAPRWLDRYLDPQDGQFDLSEHLLKRRGLLPVPIVITEPALGYGAGLAALWFKESISEAGARSLADTGRRAPPSIAAAAAFGTNNGSTGGFAGYFTPLAGDRYRVLGGAGKVGLDLDYYDRLGRASAFQLDGQGLLAQALARAGDSDVFIGARYAYLDTSSRFARERVLEIPPRDLDVRIGRLSLIIDYDSRDNFFTPSSGTFVEAELATASPTLGGNVEFSSLFLRGFHYVPVGDVVVGLRGDVRASGEGTPFFAKPYIVLRGIPALRYQDTRAAVVETELRWNVTPRWALLGFIGAGRAYGERASFDAADTVVAQGTGFRYLIARQLGLYAGLDVAWGPEERAFYIQIGGAWF
jgi:hypothetical protein